MYAKKTIIIFSLFFSVNLFDAERVRARDRQAEAKQVYQLTKAIGVFNGIKKYCSKIYSLNTKWIDKFITSTSEEAIQLIGAPRFEFIIKAEGYNTEIDVAAAGAATWCKKQRNLFRGRISERAIFR